MRQVVAPVPIIQKILGAQKTAVGVLYRLTAHCLRVERPEGVLLYHTLTGEVLLLSGEEAGELANLPGPVPPALGELASRWFLRPDGADDMALADQVWEIGWRFVKKDTAHLVRCTILTTTACNARCFYCYETGWKKSSMSEQTARDTAAYIGAHCDGEVRIRWFGGEPLVNTKAIDVITDSLRRQGVAFRSTMTTNGYLFDEALVRKAKEDWNLELVQITLDGTEAVYNARKAYVAPEGSPFRRVVRNIGLLLDAGIQLMVRLNMDEENEGDLHTLIDQLAAQFGGQPGFGIYVSVLWEDAGKAPASYTEEQRRAYAQKAQALRAYAEEKDITAREQLRSGFFAKGCGAASDNATTILPDGRLGRCESCKGGAIWGSIYSVERDEAVIQQWKERKPPEPACRNCAVYPQCFRLKKCPDWPEHCSPIEQARREDRLRRAVLGAYKDWKAAGQDRQAAMS